MSEKKRKDRYNGSISKNGERRLASARTPDDIYNGEIPRHGRLPMTGDFLMFTESQKAELLKNGLPKNAGRNHIPVAHIELKQLGYSFLITEIDPKNQDLAFGLCDYNSKLMFTTINIEMLEKNLKAEKSPFSANLDFLGKYPIAVYAKVAAQVGTIVTNDKDRLLKPLFENFSNDIWSNNSAKIDDLAPL